MTLNKAIPTVTLLFMGLMALNGCGQIYSPLSTTAPQPAEPVYPTLIADFEIADGKDNLGYEFYSEVNTSNTSMSVSYVPGPQSSGNFWDMEHNTPPAYVAGGSPLPGGTPGRALRLTGVLGVNQPPNWPYALVHLPISTVGTDINSMAPLKRLSFHYKASGGSVGKTFRVEFTDTTITDYAWYYKDITAPDSNWRQATIYFPGSGIPTFAQLSWGAPKVWSVVSKTIKTVAFFPQSDASSLVNLDLTIDDVWLQ